MKKKYAVVLGVVILALLVFNSVPRAGLAAPKSDGVSFAEFRTNAAGHLEAFYSVPLPDERRSIIIAWVQRLRGGIWINEVHLKMERVVGEPNLVWVPLSAGGEPPRPGEVCRVVSCDLSKSWALALRTKFGRLWPDYVPPRFYDRLRWSTNELIIPQTISPGANSK